MQENNTTVCTWQHRSLNSLRQLFFHLFVFSPQRLVFFLFPIPLHSSHFFFHELVTSLFQALYKGINSVEERGIPKS